MKSLVALVLFAALSVQAQQPVAVTPESLFLASKVVGESISELQASGYKAVSAPKAVLLESGCGWAGCDEIYLVVVNLSTPSSNTQTTNVAAVVKIPAVGEPTVKLANIQALEN